MANKKFTDLPVVANATLADIIAAVQSGTSSQETLQQVFDLFLSNTILNHAGNPNGSVAGSIYQLCWDKTNNLLYTCTTSGNAATAVWTLAGSVTFPIGVTSGGTGLSSTTINQLLYSSANNVIAGLATANNSVLVTSAGGVPSLSTTLPSGLTTTDPTVAQNIATKNYVDQTALNGTSVYAATITNLSATQAGAGVGATLTDNSGTFATFSVDGVSVPLNSNVLVKNYATAQNEGVYTLTRNGDGISIPWQLTRATSYDTPTEINNTGLIVIQNGTQAGTFYYNQATIITVDTTPFNFVKAGPGGTVTSIATNNGLTGGTITTSGTIGLAAIANNALLANISGGSLAPSATTLTALIDSAIGSTQGNILYRNASAWTVLAPGTANSALVTGGSGANPSYTTLPPLTKIAVQVFNAGTSTYTPTAGMKFCFVAITGGGAGAGGAAGTAGQSGQGGGGGGGGTAKKLFTAAQIGASATVVVGAKGNGGAAGNNNGTSGSASTFTPSGTGNVLTGNGGTFGFGMASTAGTNSVRGGIGGTATGGDINVAGGNGEGGVVISGSAGVNCNGGGGGSLFAPPMGNPLDGGTYNAVGYGGGGMGACANSAANVAGGNGSDGVCIVIEYIFS